MRFPQLPTLNPNAIPKLRAHVDDLTKPLGSLGRLEDLAIQLAWIAGHARPSDPDAFLLTFAGDHGLAKHGVSAYPSEVTPQMVANLALGGAASSVFCRANRIVQRVIDVGVAVPCDFEGVSQRNVVRGTRDPFAGDAMTREEAEACLQAGMDEVESLPSSPFAILCLGEMGIGNSAIAALLSSAFTGLSAETSVGPGTGVQGEAFMRKVELVKQLLAKHQPDPKKPIAVLASIGGAEFGAMAGAMIAGAARGWAVVVDGYIAGAAALLAIALEPQVKSFLIWSHRSSEPGAQKLLEKLDVSPLIDLNLRLGEGTGAALVVPIMRCACAMMREMATFSSASVSGKT
jgi:nicotinate-nucleotide--dimethylbenzimidazole phosphoribosyltransferase